MYENCPFCRCLGVVAPCINEKYCCCNYGYLPIKRKTNKLKRKGLVLMFVVQTCGVRAGLEGHTQTYDTHTCAHRNIILRV